MGTQDVDEGWPLEVVHEQCGSVDATDDSSLTDLFGSLNDDKDRTGITEIYPQEYEMVLYEGAAFRHGRPLRMRGRHFGNLFVHFMPAERSSTEIEKNLQPRL